MYILRCMYQLTQSQEKQLENNGWLGYIQSMCKDKYQCSIKPVINGSKDRFMKGPIHTCSRQLLQDVCKKLYKQTMLRTHLTTVEQNFLCVSKTVHTLILSLHPPLKVVTTCVDGLKMHLFRARWLFKPFPTSPMQAALASLQGPFNLQPLFQKGVEKWFQKSGSSNLVQEITVQEIWFEKNGSLSLDFFSGSRKVVDQKKRWFYTINPHFFRLKKRGWPEKKKSEFEEPLF